MFLRRSEIAAAVLAFPVKFADVRRRRRVLFGDDVFAGITVPRDALATRLRQVLLNLILRTRQSYAERAGRDEQLVSLVADMAGPLRSAAAAAARARNSPAASPKEALERVAGSSDAVASLSSARENETLPAGSAPAIVFSLLEIAGRMLERVSQVRP